MMSGFKQKLNASLNRSPRTNSFMILFCNYFHQKVVKFMINYMIKRNKNQTIADVKIKDLASSESEST